MIPMFIKAPRNIFGVSQYDKNSAYTMSFSASELKERVPHYRSNWNKFESKLRKKLATEPMKGESKYMKGQLKTWKKRIKTNFDLQGILFDMYCNAIAVLKVDSVYKQGKSCSPQVYVEEC